MWFWKNGSGTQYFTDGRNNGGQWFLSNYSSYNINWHNKLRYNFSSTYNASDTAFLSQWHHMIVTSDSSGSKLYLNGYEVDTTTSTSSTDEDFGINYRIGTRYTTSSEWGGFFGPIYFYNRAITASEVLQNYNSQAERFGKDNGIMYIGPNIPTTGLKAFFDVSNPKCVDASQTIDSNTRLINLVSDSNIQMQPQDTTSNTLGNMTFVEDNGSYVYNQNAIEGSGEPSWKGINNPTRVDSYSLYVGSNIIMDYHINVMKTYMVVDSEVGQVFT